MSDLQMKVGFVVLYVSDVEDCVRFWVEKVGMVERARTQAGAFQVVKVGFANQDFSFDLVPLALMRENPDGLDLATPSAAFHVPDLDAARAPPTPRVQATEISSERGPRAFAFSDPEGRWFAVLS
ncbi:MAG: Glyoxalase/Bleomycin resistance protein/Dioxygenase superfamily [Chloroflexota bacterium]